jgi:hypothetical protein
MKLHILLPLVAFTILASIDPAVAASRVALVIGNAAYKSSPFMALPKPTD